MSAVAAVVQKQAQEPLWAWSDSNLDLAPDQAVFFLRKRDHALVRVELSGRDSRRLRGEPRCEALVISRDFGVRLELPCEFADGVSGKVDAEVRLRLLDNAVEWPRRLPQTAASTPLGAAESPERALGRLVAALFEAEIAAFAAGRSYAEFSRGLNDPHLVAELEQRLRRTLGRWTEEGIVSLLAAHLLGAESSASLERSREDREHAKELRQARQANELAAVECERHILVERNRLDVEHAREMLRVRQADELAELARRAVLAAPDEVRWRLFAPADLQPAGARPPRLVKESSAPYEALVSGQHLQLVVRPVKAGHVYVLALGPYSAEHPATVAGVACPERSREVDLGSRRPQPSEYRWMRLFGNDGRSDLVERAARPGGNRLGTGDTLLFPGDAGAAELFQHYLTMDSAPGWETLVVAITPQALPDTSLGSRLPQPPPSDIDFPALQTTLTRDLRTLFGTEARLYLFQFFHS